MNDANPKKILLAEHDAFLINVYAKELRKFGYSTSIALDGEIAIARVKSIGPDLLILDESLPKINGVSVLQIIRKEMKLGGLKIVMLSDFGQEKYFEFGVDKNFIKSENTAEEIVKEIKRILN